MKRLFGISQNVKSRLVRVCTAALFREAVDSPQTARVCAEIADALEAVKRGELSREEFETLKADRKRLLPVLTPHATFTQGRRVNTDAVPSGLCMLDVDHLPDARGTLKADRKRLLPVLTPHATFTQGRRVNTDAVPSGLCMLDVDHLPDARGFYEANVRGREEVLGILLAFTQGRRVNTDAVPSGLCMLDVDHLPDARGFYEANVRGREEVLGILLAHITPSCEGLRLVFVLPDAAMELEAAQRWMAGRLGMKDYDGAVKDLARCSFLVPRDYFLYLNEAELFGEAAANSSTAEGSSSAALQLLKALLQLQVLQLLKVLQLLRILQLLRVLLQLQVLQLLRVLLQPAVCRRSVRRLNLTLQLLKALLQLLRILQLLQVLQLLKVLQLLQVLQLLRVLLQPAVCRRSVRRLNLTPVRMRTMRCPVSGECPTAISFSSG